MKWSNTLVMAAVLVPAIVMSQGRGGMGGGMGGGRGGGRGGRGGGGAARALPKFPSAKDLEKHNPAALLVDKRRKLSLADSQISVLKAIEQKIFERNAGLLSQYDSVRREYRPPSGEPVTAADDKARMESMAHMRFMQGILEQLIERRRVDVTEALGQVPDSSRKKAGEYLDDQERAFLELIPSSRAIPGGGGRRGRPDPPR